MCQTHFAQHTPLPFTARASTDSVTLANLNFNEHLVTMARRYYSLPPLTTLAAFEAAARHLSFKNAAQELSVTPGAVSHHIKALEEELGGPLFSRKYRGVELTTDGEELFEVLAAGFSRVSLCLKGIQGRNHKLGVTIGATSAVATLWLAPSVLRFWRHHVDAEVNQVIRDTEALNTPDVDLFVHYGRVQDQGLTHTELFRDTLVPLGNAAVQERLAQCSLADLAQERLIHLETAHRNWTTWQDWLSKLGYDGPVAPGIRVNNYAIALQAAEDGAGIALGWTKLTKPLQEHGKLRPISGYSLPAPHRFYLVEREMQSTSHSAKLLREWLVQEASHIT